MKPIGVEGERHLGLVGERPETAGTNRRSMNSFQTWNVVTKKS